MKTTTTFAALMICVALAAAANAQRPNAMMVAPQDTLRERIGTALNHSEYLGLAIESHNARGLKVFQTTPGGAAETVGLEKGDIILGAEGYYVDTLDQLESAMRTSFGSITLTVINVRNGRQQNAKMTLGRNGGSLIGSAVGYDSKLGIGIEMLYGNRNKVTSIENGSVAQKLGLTVGDIIISSSENNGRYTVKFDDAETGRRYTSWYQNW